MFTGCSQNEDLVPSNYPSDNVIRVTAEVNEAKTRSSEGTPLNEDFSLTVVPSNHVKKYTYSNKVFSKGTDGKWNCKDMLLWQNDKTPVTIAALAPAQSIFDGIYDEAFKVIDNYFVDPDQSTANPKNDLLYYYNNNFVPGTDLNSEGKLNIQFNHAFCMMEIVVTIGTEFNQPKVLEESPIQKVTIIGTRNNADIVIPNVSSDDFKVVPVDRLNPIDIITTKGDFIKPADANKNAVSKFSCILIPQTIDVNTFEVTLQTVGKLYVWKYQPKMTLKSGCKYTLNLNMGQDIVTLKEDGIKSNAWEEGSGYKNETE